MDDQMMLPGMEANANPGVPNIKREEPDPSAERKALVTRWVGKITEAKKFWEKKAFKQMRLDMDFALYGADKEWIDNDNYTVPIVQRHINLAVAGLYAKNPVADAKHRRRLMYKLWDGRVKSLKEALANPMDPNNMALIAEVDQVQQKLNLIDKIGRTLEVLFTYYTGEQEPMFKRLLKQLIRRVKVCGVGYIWVDFQRLLEVRPEVTAQIEDMAAKLASIERMAQDVQEGDIVPGDAEIEELKSALEDLKKMETVIVREGPVFDFPRATEIIIDPDVIMLEGFVGAGWIAREMHLTPDKIKDIYKVDIGKKFTAYTKGGDSHEETSDEDDVKEREKACVWIVYNKALRQSFVVIDGYPDFVQEPATPTIEFEQFWPCVALVFNQVEHESVVFPPSDVYMLRHPQKEYNTSRQGLREHRKQNRPVYVVTQGALEDDDKVKLRDHESGEVLELNGLQPGQDVNTLIQTLKHAPVDPALYDTNPSMEDVFRTVGSQDANFGSPGDATATGSTIAENSRMSTVNSNVDDLDDFLSTIARMFAEIALLHLSSETVVEIAGEGAVWPEWSRTDVVKQVTLEIKGGSSGRPNQAADLAKMERAIPYLIQFPNLNPTPIIERYGKLLDFDMENLIAEGAPSIQAINAIMANQARAMQGGSGGAGAGGNPQAVPGQGGQPTDPNAQGAEGGMNLASPQVAQPGPQPAFPEGLA